VTTWAYDIETEAWDKFVLGCAVSDDGDRVTFDDESEIEEWYHSTNASDLILCHNGGHFDMLHLLDAVDGPWSGTLAGSGLVSIRQPGYADVRDSMRVFPFSLQDWTGKKSETGCECVCGEHCGGFCQIKRKMPRARRERVREYCFNDVDVLLEAWLRDIARFEAIGVEVRNTRGEIRRTLGAMAHATSEKLCDLPPSLETISEYHHARRAYYGGRNEVFDTGGPFPEGSEQWRSNDARWRSVGRSGHRFDINSMYSWALLGEFPTGEQRELNAKGARNAFARQKPGLYGAKVFVPYSRVPLLPMRLTDESVVWACGHVIGVWPLPELQWAVSQGAQIQAFLGASVWPKTSRVYEPFIREFYPHRERATREGDKGWARALKWFLNSKSGKVTQGPDMAKLHVRPETLQEGWKWLGGDAWAETHQRVAPSAYPCHGAYLTAYARGPKLGQALLESEHPLYCDTDAVYRADSEMLPNDDAELGAWKYEGAMTGWRCLAPKLYRYRTAKKVEVKAKGIPYADDKDFHALYRGREVSKSRGVEGVRTALGRHGVAFKARTLTRSRRADPRVAGTRLILSNGQTVPIFRASNGELSWPGSKLRPDTLVKHLSKPPQTVG